MVFGSVADVRTLLDSGLNPNAATKSGGTTALMMAAPDVGEDEAAARSRRQRQRARADAVLRADGRGAVSGRRSRRSTCCSIAVRRSRAPADGAPVFNANPFFLASYAGNATSLKRLLEAGGKMDEPMIADRHVAHDTDARRVQVRRRRGGHHADRSRRAGRVRRWQRHHDARPVRAQQRGRRWHAR